MTSFEEMNAGAEIPKRVFPTIFHKILHTYHNLQGVVHKVATQQLLPPENFPIYRNNTGFCLRYFFCENVRKCYIH